MILHFTKDGTFSGASNAKIAGSDVYDFIEINDEDYKEAYAYTKDGNTAVLGDKYDVYVETPENIATQEQEAINTQAREYLSSTDWYITRQAETGTEAPADVLTKRAEARASVMTA
jgi:hypothetical protein